MSDDNDKPKGPQPKWLTGDHHENSARSKKHEMRLSKQLGARRYSGSGNRIKSKYAELKINGKKPSDVLVGGTRSTKQHPPTDKGDFATPKIHFEHKFTRAKSITVQLDWLLKVKEGGVEKAKDPGLIVTFDRGVGVANEEWAFLPLSVVERLLKLGDRE